MFPMFRFTVAPLPIPSIRSNRLKISDIIEGPRNHSADLIRIRKRCVPNIIPEVLHPNLDPTFKRSDWDNIDDDDWNALA
jgi:hypothetical protein